MKKLFDFIKKLFAILKGILGGHGVSSIDRAEREAQVRDLEREDEIVDKIVEGGNADELNNEFGWVSQDTKKWGEQTH